MFTKYHLLVACLRPVRFHAPLNNLTARACLDLTANIGRKTWNDWRLVAYLLATWRLKYFVLGM